MSNNIISMNNGPRRPTHSALDEFLSESAIQRVSGPDRKPRVDPQPPVEPMEVVLEPIEVIWQQSATTTQKAASPVQIWPMLAAALVALGVSLLALALLAKYMHL